MLTVIVLSGDIREDQVCRAWLQQADDIICADGGARHLRRLRIWPHLLVGDLDSIDATSQAWLRSQAVAIERHPVRKDETDAELAMLAALRRNPQPDDHHSLVVLGALGSRPDHVLATQMLAVRLARPNRAWLLSDGVSSLYTLTGGQVLELACPEPNSRGWYVSTIPFSDQISGLTYSGLGYPLRQATLQRGSTRGISNQFTSEGRATLSLDTGTALVCVTRENV